MSNKLIHSYGLGYGRLGSTVNILPAALAPLQKKVVTDEATQKTREKQHSALIKTIHGSIVDPTA
jgi:hypothetical protein